MKNDIKYNTKMRRTKKVHMQECSREEPSPAESGSGRKDVEVPLGADFRKTILQEWLEVGWLGNMNVFPVKLCRIVSIEIR